MVLVLHEWETMTGPYGLRAAPVAALAFVGLSVLLAHNDPERALIAALVVAAGLLLARAAEPRLSWLAPGVVYAGLPGIAAVILRDSGALGLVALVFVFAVVVATDSAAYFSGRLIGGPKLWPRLSPKKTWSGSVGGALAAMVAGLGVAVAAGLDGKAELAVVALALSVVSQAGDLGESAMKRHFGVKDSGTLIPGHGGIMDRIDGLVVAMVVAVAIGALNAHPGDVAAGLLIW